MRSHLSQKKNAAGHACRINHSIHDSMRIVKKNFLIFVTLCRLLFRDAVSAWLCLSLNPIGNRIHLDAGGTDVLIFRGSERHLDVIAGAVLFGNYGL